MRVGIRCSDLKYDCCEPQSDWKSRAAILNISPETLNISPETCDGSGSPGLAAASTKSQAVKIEKA
jgi:hypothetical protein